MVVDGNDSPLPPAELGEIVGRLDSVIAGILNDPERTAGVLWRSLARQDFFRSSSLEHFGDDGFFHLVDRRTDVIISGGNNYAADLVKVLTQYPDVLDVSVIAVLKNRRGYRPLALDFSEPGTETQ